MVLPPLPGPHRGRTRVRLPALLTAALAVVGLAVPLVLGAAAPSTAQPVAGTLAGADAPELRRVEILPLRGGFIDPPVVAQIADVLDLAAREGAELVVLQVTSRAGVSVDVAELTARIAASPVPVAVSVGPIGTAPRAGGAAAALWLAAHVRSLAPDATVGPLEPLDLRALDAASPDAAAILAGTPRSVTPSSDALRVLAELTVGEVSADVLVAAGLARVSTGIEPLLVELDGVEVLTADGPRTLRLRPDELQVRFHSLGLVRRLLHAASTAPFVYLLLVVGLGLLLFEVFQPGFGVAGLAGVITTVVGIAGAFTLPVRWWAVALVVLGLLLYALDTAIAGFGPVTLAATAAFATGSWWFYAAPALQLEWWVVALATLTALIFFVFVLTVVLRAQAGPEGTVVEELVGRPGVVRSTLNPEGHVFIDGALWRARWIADGKAGVGSAVVVTAVDGPVVLVEAFDPAKVHQGLAVPGDAS
jgi:membrane-bound serine protease (ClpP class)